MNLLRTILLTFSLFKAQNFGLKAYSFTYFDGDTELYYQYPNQPISNPNITIAAVFSLVEFDKGDNLYNIRANSNIMTMLCEVERYNSGGGRFPVRGVFNFLAYETNFFMKPSGYVMAREVLGQNVYYAKNSTTLGVLKDTPINVILRMGNAKDYSTEAAFFSGVALPSVNYENIRLSFYDLNYPLLVPSKQLDFASMVLDRPSAQIFTNYVINVLSHFNWSFISAIFSLDVTGFIAQNSFLSAIEQQSDKFTFSCAYVIDSTDPESFANTLQNLATCLLDTTKIRVIVVWMRAKDGLRMANQLNELIGGPDSGFVYIFPEIPAEVSPAFNLPGSLFFEPLLLTDPDQFSCSNEAKNTLISLLGPKQIDEVTILRGFCKITDPELPFCVEDRDSPNCLCLDDLVFYAPYASDSVNLLMKSLLNMQKNCAALSECVDIKFPGSRIDYCSLQDFTGDDLFKAMQCSPLVGSSGFISFESSSIARATFPMLLRQFQEPGQSPLTIGSFTTENITYFNNSNFPASGGGPPVSAIIPNDPTLSDGFVMAFFIVDMVFILYNLFLLAFIAFNRQNRIIRRSGFSSSMVILIGLLLTEISQIFMCLSLTSALCKLIDIFMLIGISFVISTLCAKLFRIYRIFQNPTAQAINITDRHLIVFTVVTTIVTMLIYILYSSIGGGLQPVTKSSSNPFYTYIICEVPNDAIQLTGLITFYVYYISYFLIAAILCFLTRKTMRQFNESLNVAFIVYSWLGLCIIYAPIYYAQSNSTDSNQTRYAIRFMAMDLAVGIALGVITYTQCFKVIRWNRKHAIPTDPSLYTR